jgi:hypothetical protein
MMTELAALPRTPSRTLGPLPKKRFDFDADEISTLIAALKSHRYTIEVNGMSAAGRTAITNIVLLQHKLERRL